MDARLMTCDVCGAPGRHIVRDVQEVEPVDGFRRFEPRAETHIWCDVHVTKSKTYPRLMTE